MLGMADKMFGKNYEKEIIELNKQVSELSSLLSKTTKVLMESDKVIRERIDGFEKLILVVAKVQKSHKDAIIKISKNKGE